MNWFEKIKKYYDASLWTGKMVGNAVAKKKITAEQYKEITGEEELPLLPTEYEEVFRHVLNTLKKT